MGATLSGLFPHAPEFTESNVPDLLGKVYLITGASGGVGQELARLLYSRNARVWIAARSQHKAAAAIAQIKNACPGSIGELHFLRVDLADLATIKPAVDQFLARESSLHVLWNNAGVMSPLWERTVPRTAQGLEMQMGVNCVGSFLLAKLLTPLLAQTAKLHHPGAVRVVWVSSMGAELSPYTSGLPMEDVNFESGSWVPPGVRYLASKSGNFLHAVEYARRHADDNIISVAMNPGNLDSDLWRHLPAPVLWFLRLLFLYPSVYGAYTELFAGLSPEVTPDKNGCWIAPWGVIRPIKKSLLEAARSKVEGGSGVGQEFWRWTEKQVEPYC